MGELTITLEDVVNNFFIPVFGNENPFDISLSSKDLKIEDKLFNHFGGCTASSGGKLARMGKWVMSLSQEKDKAFRQAGFLTLWLSKFLFSKFLGYGIKSIFFPLAIRLARGAQYLYPPPPPLSCFWAMFILNWTCFMEMRLKATLAILLLCPSIVLFFMCSYRTVLLSLWQSAGN